MADYKGVPLPEVGGDQNEWGNILNEQTFPALVDRFRVRTDAGRVVEMFDGSQYFLIAGETGQRNITAALGGQLGPNAQARLSRSGNAVELAIWGADTPAGLSIQGVVPSGFRPTAERTVAVGDDSGAAIPSMELDRQTGSLRVNAPFGGSGVTFTLTYSTNDPWPATLPGTADGPLPA